MNQSGMNQGNDKMASKQRTGKLDVDPEDGSYEDDFEKELESELSDEPRGGATSKGNTSSSAGRGRSQGPAGRTVMSHGNDTGGYYVAGTGPYPVVLDHTAYPDCDGDLEHELTLGLRRRGGAGGGGGGRGVLDSRHLSRGYSNGHFHHFERDEVTRGEESSGAANKARLFLEYFRRRGAGGSHQDNFFDAAEEVGYDSTPDSGVHESLLNMDPEQRARLEEEWRTDLAKTEDEIQTLRSVLLAKVRHSQELKRKLGITVWREFREDWEQGFKNVKESDALKNVNDKLSEVQVAITNAPLYQKTETVLKTASEKTTTVIGTFSASVTKKIGEVKNSPTFKSFEEKVGSAYTNVKTKVSGSRSNSMQSFEEALANAEGRTSTGATPSTTPMIPEEKPLS